MTSKTKLVLSTNIEENDWAPLFAIMYKSFEDEPSLKALYPNGTNPTYRSEYAHRFKNEFLSNTKGTTTTEKFIAKVTNKGSGEIISFVSGSIYDGPLGLLNSDNSKPLPPIKLPMIAGHKEREFYEWCGTARRTALRTEVEDLWVPNVYIQPLCTDPRWQRRGAASILMNWVIDLARAKKINRCSLTASPSTIDSGFYEKWGFRVVYQKNLKDNDRFPEMDGKPLVVMISDLE